jgi:RNA polymerase II subunit A small phosphatase-like protein
MRDDGRMAGRTLLILDLDETLVHATDVPLDRAHDFEVGPYVVYRRPGVDVFIRAMSMHFELAVWTSSTRLYAEPVVAELFPVGIKPSFVWSRERCTRRFDPDTHDFEWAKNLDKVKRRGYALERVLIVDDTPKKLERHYGNLVRVKPFEGDPSDTELHGLTEYLPTLADAANVRRIEKRYWRKARVAADA